jgi:hypothetical protein
MKKLVGFWAIVSLSASPAAASVRDVAFASTAERVQPQTSSFVGVTYRLGLDGKSGKPHGRASLQVSSMVSAPDASTLRIGQGLEIVSGKAGKPALLIAGREAGELGDRSHLSTGATVALALVGVVVVAAGVAALLIDERLDRQNQE